VCPLPDFGVAPVAENYGARATAEDWEIAAAGASIDAAEAVDKPM